MPFELCLVAIGFGAGCMGAYEWPEVFVDAFDVDFEGVSLKKEPSAGSSGRGGGRCLL